jgi:hypothetical protein
VRAVLEMRADALSCSALDDFDRGLLLDATRQRLPQERGLGRALGSFYERRNPER